MGLATRGKRTHSSVKSVRRPAQLCTRIRIACRPLSPPAKEQCRGLLHCCPHIGVSLYGCLDHCFQSVSQLSFLLLLNHRRPLHRHLLGLWTERLPRRAQEEKTGEGKRNGGKILGRRGGDTWKWTWWVSKRWTIYGMNNRKKENRKCLA